MKGYLYKNSVNKKKIRVLQINMMRFERTKTKEFYFLFSKQLKNLSRDKHLNSLF